MKKQQPHFYQKRINKALDYLNHNLEKKLKVNQLAKISCFSSFHFQRIYHALQGETPYETLLRLRLEKAVFYLQHRQTMKVIDIAMAVGFNSPENFSRQFKSRYHCTPSEFKNNKKKRNSRIYQERLDNGFYHTIEESRAMPTQNIEVKLTNLPSIKIAFIRAIFGNDGSGLIERYNQLMKWCKKNSLKTKGPMKRFGMSVDDPDVTPEKMYRYDFAVSCPEFFESTDLIEFGTIPAGKYATVHCQGTLHDVAQTWDYLYKTWLPQSGFVPIDFPAIEEFIQGPEEIGWDKFNLKCRIPVTEGEQL